MRGWAPPKAPALFLLENVVTNLKISAPQVLAAPNMPPAD